MMTTHTEPVPASEDGVHVDLQVPAAVTPGLQAFVRIRLTDTATGRPITDIGRSHEAWMHVIVTRDDLGTFSHVHAQPDGRPGEFTVAVTFPTPGRYTIHEEFRRKGQMSDLLDRHSVTIGGPVGESSPTPVPSPRSQVVGGMAVTLEGDATVGDNRFTYRFADAATGKPITGLRPYLAAAGHIVVMPLNGNGFAHEHAEQEDRNGRPIFALPSQRFGPELHVDANLPSAGLYRLWGQFRAPDGQVITTTFTVQAAQ